MHYPFLLLLAFSCLNAGAQRYSALLPLAGDANYPGLFFRTGDGLYLRLQDKRIDRVTLHSDTREETGKDSISHIFVPGSLDTIYAGSFTTPGLYVVRTDTALRGSGTDEANYEHVHFQDIDSFQTSWFIHFEKISNQFIGVSWHVGSELAHQGPVYDYLYCYGPGGGFPAGGSSLLPVPEGDCDTEADTSISILTDSLNYAFDNINYDSLQLGLTTLAAQIAGSIDTLKTITFSLFLNTGEPVRVLVRTADSISIETLHFRCIEVLNALIDLLNQQQNWKFAVKGSDGKPLTVMFTPDLTATLKQVAGAFFSICPGFNFSTTDPTCTSQSLAAYASGHTNGDNIIYAGSLTRNGSRQWMLHYSITGVKPKPR